MPKERQAGWVCRPKKHFTSLWDILFVLILMVVRKLTPGGTHQNPLINFWLGISQMSCIERFVGSLCALGLGERLFPFPLFSGPSRLCKVGAICMHLVFLV